MNRIVITKLTVTTNDDIHKDERILWQGGTRPDLDLMKFEAIWDNGDMSRCPMSFFSMFSGPQENLGPKI